MLRVALIGCNSHGAAWAPLMNGVDTGGFGRLTPAQRARALNMRVTAVWSRRREEAEEIARRCGVGEVPDDPQSLVGEVDAALVDELDFRAHLALARPFLEAGMPVFVNRPLAGDVKDASEIVRLAEQHGAPLMTGSALRWAGDAVSLGRRVGEAAPVLGYLCTSPASAFWMYAPHAIELCYAVVGGGVEEVACHGEITDERKPSRPMTALIHLRHGPRGEYPVNGVAQLCVGMSGVQYEMKVFGRETQVEGSVSYPSADDDLWLPILLRMSQTFETRVEPTPHAEILEEMRVLLAAHKSNREKRTVGLSEVEDHRLTIDPSLAG